MDNFETELEAVTDAIQSDYHSGRIMDSLDSQRFPDRDAVARLTVTLRQIIFPAVDSDPKEAVRRSAGELSGMIGRILGDADRGQQLTLTFFRRIPEVRALAQTDLQAAFDGDPAAASFSEIILAYPGLFAVTVYRLAHELHLLEIPLLPRMMTEYAHSVTGIDIHPGARIGSSFFIDHGTGVVIGETTVIGRGVKLYQGVTLGGLSTRGGQALRGKRRHPTIGDNVTIYANASILGGDTIIGENSVIGANAFILASVAPNTTVTAIEQALRFQTRKEK